MHASLATTTTTSSSKTSQPKLFITGATGYVGGTFLAKLLASPQRLYSDITVLVRSQEAASKFQSLGMTPVIGSLEDAEILRKAVSEADVTLNFADADNLGAIKTIVEGLSNDGKRRILIHTSGTAVLVDDAKGEYASDKIVSDLDIEAIHSIPTTQIHRNVDTYIFDNLKNFESIIVCPPTIYGLGLGLFNKSSIQIPFLIRAYLKFGKAATIGKGANIWSNIHVEDLADFYILLLRKAWEGKASIGRDGWYFVESGEHAWRDVIVEIGKQLYKRGAIKQEEVVKFTTEEVDKYLGILGWVGVATNSRSSADRARALGWRSSGTKGTVIDSIEGQVETILALEKAKE